MMILFLQGAARFERIILISHGLQGGFYLIKAALQFTFFAGGK